MVEQQKIFKNFEEKLCKQYADNLQNFIESIDSNLIPALLPSLELEIEKKKSSFWVSFFVEHLQILIP